VTTRPAMLQPQPCTIGGAGTMVDATYTCAGTPATIDEMALFTARFAAAN